ncbi:MAG: phenylalanine--tRNA ligase subunit alpha, partial [Candidatus Daviesbacteria bacterium]|nr:phenylalanine--tRNA ligase subunit alpha [Candidatus Daviesbacteria bacterium]
MEEKISQIQKIYLQKIGTAQALKELDEIFLALFGKNGVITLLPKDFAKLSLEEKQKIGPLFNRIKTELEQVIEKRRENIREAGYTKLTEEKLDFNPVDIKQRQGHLHLATQFKKEIIDLFNKLGFYQFDAPHVEWDKYNFEYLNIPKDHPSRDMWDTLYVDTSKLDLEPGQMLLRTHTSNFWPRLMEKGKTPIRAMSFDRCFRYEAVDTRHSHTFNQFEIAVIGTNITMANLKYLSDYLL